jgi:outer membrane lipoprotein-sorting protein
MKALARKRLLFLHALPACGLLLLGMDALAAPPTAAEIVEHLDAVRRPARSFKVHLKITDIRDGKPAAVTELDIFARKVDGYPDFDILTHSLLPEADRGKVLLNKGTSVWLYDPKSSRPVSFAYEKIRSRFFVAYGLTSSFAREYDTVLLGVEEIEDAARKPRSCYHLHLTARKDVKTSQGEMHYWVDAKSLLPVRGHVHSGSGRLLRTAYYTRYQNVLGRLRPTRLLVVSGVERGLLQDIEFSEFAHRDFPESAFAQESMAAISKGGLP